MGFSVECVQFQERLQFEQAPFIFGGTAVCVPRVVSLKLKFFHLSGSPKHEYQCDDRRMTCDITAHKFLPFLEIWFILQGKMY